MQKKFEIGAKVKHAEFTVREDHTLALRTELPSGERTLIFHDSIRKGGKRYHLFTDKTSITCADNTVILRTAATEEESGAPIAGLLITYTFTFNKEWTAFYLSVSFGSDMRVSGCSVCLMDVSWEGMEPTSFTGYEYDAEDKPFGHTFPLPTQKNPRALGYEERKTTRLHVALERTVTYPHAFQKAVALHAENAYLAILGGTPTYHIEADYIQTFFELEQKMLGDLRFYSGKNSPGAWFLLEEPDDFFAAAAVLEAAAPETEEHILVPFPEKEVTLQSGEMRCTLVKTRDGVWIRPLYAGEETAAQPMPLFFAELWDTEYERAVPVDAGNGWEHVAIIERKNYLRITLSEPENGEAAGLTVVAEAFAEPQCHRISWQMKVVNRSERWSLTNVSYPQCLAHGYERAYVSSYSGMLFKHFNQRCTTIRGKYPTGNRFNMAYLALYNVLPMEDRNTNNGFYMGIHDTEGVPKLMSLVGAPKSNCTYLFCECTPPYARRAGNSFTLPGKMVWQRFNGDWFDATQIYRDFVFGGTKWLSPLRGRADSPEWLRKMPMWIIHYLPNDNPDANPIPITLKTKTPDQHPSDWYRTAVRFREEIGVPVAYHLYNWHWIPFNNDNPNYFPVHHDLKEGMRALKAADIRVVPYVQGYFWDMRDRRGDDYRFGNEAEQATAKHQNGQSVYYTYASTEPSGEPARLATMCPTTTTWKSELRRICRRLCKEYGMDGVYLDVMSLNYDHCYDETHLHTPGWGDYWWKAFAELIAGIRAEAPEDFGVISECVAEVYSGAVDGMLSWTWTQVDSVPSYPAVYGGRTAIIGRLYTANKWDDHDYFRFQIAQSLVYGQQLGWIHPVIVDDPVQFPFLKKMAQIRWQYSDFFAEAQMLRPAAISGQVPLLDCRAYLRGQLWNHEKLIQTGTWEDAGGQRRMFVINASDKEVEITLSVYENEYLLPEKIEGFDTEEGFELLNFVRENGICKLTCRLAPCGVGILSWTKRR